MSGEAWVPPRSLDSMGRCCGRKPHPHKRPVPHAVCLTCSVEYRDGAQFPNWAWKPFGEGYFPTYPTQEPYRTILQNEAPRPTGDTHVS